MNLMYFFLVICLLGSAVMYGIVVFLLSCLVSACQTPDSSLDFLVNKPYTTQVLANNIINNQENKVKSDISNTHITDAHSVNTVHNSNNLQDVLLLQNNPAAMITNQKKVVPLQWQILYHRYEVLPPVRQQQISDFYKEKSYIPVWITDTGELNQVAIQIHDLLNQEIYLTTPLRGYFLSKIPYLKQDKPSLDFILQKDLEFTLSLLPALEKIRNGITYIKGAGISENNGYKPFDFKTTLLNFSLGNAVSEVTNLTNFHEQYSALKQQIKILNDLKNKGGYVTVPNEHILKLGMTDKNIIIIRNRLMQYGLMTHKINSDYYDNDLETQIMAFQASRGIKPDGVIGSEVYNAFNQSINQDLTIILANIERIRRSQNMTSNEKQVHVNVPEMVLYVKKGEQDLLSMKTIVGRKDRKTPIFNDFIEYVDFNPYWNIPHSLATKDILPKLKNNPSYFVTQGVKVFRGNVLVNPNTINWKQYSETYFPFTLRQEPSKHNALGTVKFIFPNEYAVYLHDTPAKGIFYKNIRSESSGCIRISKPRELAILLLDNVASEAKINQIFASSKNKVMYFPHSIPVSIEYLTAFVLNGVLNIRPDIYDYDKMLINSLIAGSANK